jgi:magnesium-transporting ATPase (P-type)
VSLAIGAQRMAARHALVRHLEAAETLGSTTFICTDKTGTLTRNEMSVVEVWMPAGRAVIEGNGYEPGGHVECDEPALVPLRELAAVAARCSNGHVVEEDGRFVPRGDPMEAALDVLARRVGTGGHDLGGPDRRRYPFDPRRRRMSVVVGDRVLVKGAPDAVLPRCSHAPGDGAGEAFHALAARGFRILAVASRALGTGELPGSADEAERNLTLLGLVALEDPPRQGAAAAIRDCRRAGIKVAMVTGDHPATARAVAREVGLLTSL